VADVPSGPSWTPPPTIRIKKKRTGYGLDGPVSIPGSARFLSSPQRPDRFCGPPSVLSTGYRAGSFPGGKAAGREVGHSPPTSAEVKNVGAIPPFPICLHGLVLN
jgi:hypothetical protein